MPVTLSSTLAADISDLERDLVALDTRVRTTPSLAGTPHAIVLAEALGSSRLENIHVTVRELADHEARLRAKRQAPAAAELRSQDEIAGQVFANVEAIEEVTESFRTSEAITLDIVLSAHRRLMAASPHPAIGGVVRTEQNWVGGMFSTPPTATFVPPPPEMVDDLLGDLCAAMSSDMMSPAVQAALVHVQFETIHPFGDGNGRLGRALISALLGRRGLTPTAVCPISPVLAVRKESYIDGLRSYRHASEPDSDAARRGVAWWLEMFVGAAATAAIATAEFCDKLEALDTEWRHRLSARRGSAADRFLPHLVALPVFSAGDIERTLGVSRQSASVAANQLQAAGVVEPVGSQQRHRRFVAQEALEALETLAAGPPRRF